MGLALEKTIRVMEEGLEQGLHIGGQLYARYGGEEKSHAFGEAKPGMAMTEETLMLWLSSGKPLTAGAIALLVEDGQLDYGMHVCEVVPEFGQNRKENITIENLLTHTGGFRSADKIPPTTPWDEMIERICAAVPESNWDRQSMGAYHTASAWFVLGEIIQRVTGRRFEEFVSERLLGPLRMEEVHFSLNGSQLAKYEGKVGIMHATARGAPRPLPLENPQGFGLPRPGSSARGPIKELGYFYEMLLGCGSFKGRQVLKESTVAELTRRRRVGVFDQTFMHKIDFGLGLIINSNRYGAQTVPYGFGFHASDDTFGHGGAESSCGFADPKHKLVVAWVFNGMPGEEMHQVRSRAINTSIYEDLGIISAQSGTI